MSRRAYQAISQPDEPDRPIASAFVGTDELRTAEQALRIAYDERETTALHNLCDLDGVDPHGLDAATRQRYDQRARLLTRDCDPIAQAVDEALQAIEKAGKLMRRAATKERAEC